MDVLGYRQGHYPFDRALFLPLEQTPERDFKRQAHYTKSNMSGKQNDRIKELIYLYFILYPFLYSELEQDISFFKMKTTNKKKKGFIANGKQIFICKIVNSYKITDSAPLLRLSANRSLGCCQLDLQKNFQLDLFHYGIRTPQKRTIFLQTCNQSKRTYLYFTHHETFSDSSRFK